MRVHILLEYRWDGSKYVLVHEDGYEYTGPVCLCKGDSTAQDAEKSQAAFNTTMQGIMQQQFASSQQTLNFMKGKLDPMINNPKGMSDDALAAARTSATDQNSAAYQNAGRTMQNNQALKSGDLPSGVNAQIAGSLASEEAANQAGSQNAITLQNEQLKQSNYWNSMNALNGVAAQNNPTGMAGAANQGAGAVANLSEANTKAAGPGIGQILGQVVGNVAQAGGMALMCWIAAACFNEDFYGPKTLTVRNYLLNTWNNEHWYAPFVLRMYAKFGLYISTKPTLVRLLKPLFDGALRRAQCLPTRKN